MDGLANGYDVTIPDFVMVSHHPRDHYQSPCASLFQLFIGENRVKDLVDHIYLKGDQKTIDHQIHRLFSYGNVAILFNSLQSLLEKNSLPILEEAALHHLPVTIYWHETAWNIRYLANRTPDLFARLRDLIPALEVTHWVPTSQCMHAVATVIGSPIETFRIVYEVVDFSRFSLAPRGPGRPLVVAGAGTPDARKGVDIFSWIAARLKETGGDEVEARWYSPRPNKTESSTVPHPEAVRWMGYAKEFETELRSVDVFLLTSRDDPSPLVCFEALASGVPVFVFASSGFGEMLPREFVASDAEDMLAKVRAYRAGGTWAPEDLRALAEELGSASNFVRRAFRGGWRREANLPDMDKVDPIPKSPPDLGKKLADEKARLITATARLRRRERASLFTAGPDTSVAKKQLAPALPADVTASITAQDLSLIDGDLAVDHLAPLMPERADELRLREMHRLACIRVRSLLYGRTPSPQEGAVRRVIVVGNSPSALELELGRLIDAADCVVRLNNFVTKGYEKFVGSRTDFVVISPACKPSEELATVDPDKIIVFGANMRKIEDIKARINAPNGVKISVKSDRILSSELYVDELCLRMDLAIDGKQWPSTGVAAIQWAVDRFRGDQVLIHGFSFYSEAQGKTLTRYFGAPTKADGFHDFEKERAFVAKLLKRNRVYQLDSAAVA